MPFLSYKVEIYYQGTKTDFDTIAGNSINLGIVQSESSDITINSLSAVPGTTTELAFSIKNLKREVLANDGSLVLQFSTIAWTSTNII